MQFVRTLTTRTLTGSSWIAMTLLAALGSAGCGYALQNSRSELLDKEGIRTVYVQPLINNTFKPGVENVVYNALIRTLISHRKVRLVQDPEAADAILAGDVGVAQFSISSTTSATGLIPHLPNPLPTSNQNLTNTAIASIYSADLGCAFSLSRRVTPPGKNKVLWASSFSRSKPFSAANQLDVPGTTSALINESEFERALGEMATNMMDDLHESMLAIF
jgi:hypothetical protein